MRKEYAVYHRVMTIQARGMSAICGHTIWGVRKVVTSQDVCYLRHRVADTPEGVSCQRCIDIAPLVELAHTEL